MRPSSVILLADDLSQLVEKIGMVLLEDFNIFPNLIPDSILNLPDDISLPIFIALLSGEHFSIILCEQSTRSCHG